MKVFAKLVSAAVCAASLTGCTGKVLGSIKEQAEIILSSQTASLSLVSNSTKTQAQCAAGNTVVVQSSLPAATKYYCRDKSKLISGAKVGLVCAGGVTINEPVQTDKVVECKDLVLCGRGVASRETIASRYDGSAIEALKFRDVPWGCNATVEYSKDPNFPPDDTEMFSTEIAAPTCPFCATTNGPNCGACAALEDEHIKNGQVISNCTGKTCASCKVGMTTVPHDQSFTFYSANKNKCPNRCKDLAQARVCNNGLFAGDVKYQQVQCVDSLCGCTLPGSGVVYNSGASVRIFQNKKLACGQTCKEISVNLTCSDGAWMDEKGAAFSETNIEMYPTRQCTDPVCNCERSGRRAVKDGQTATVYSVGKVGCQDSCSTKQGTVSCKAGVLTAVTAGADAFGFDSCESEVCSCPLPGGGSVLNGQSITLFKSAKATCDDKNACSAAGASVQVKCTDGVLSSFDQSTFKFKSCSAPECNCSANGVKIDIGASVTFYSSKDPTPNTCEQSSAVFKCDEGPKLVGSAQLSQYPFIVCKSESDSGTLGGTGGGTGNDEGPGAALRKRYGAIDLGGGSGGPSWGFSASFGLRKASAWRHQFCKLPWGDGEIEHWGSTLAFDKTCVVPPDSCTAHRQLRTCTQGWSGSDSFRYPSCIEKASCP